MNRRFDESGWGEVVGVAEGAQQGGARALGGPAGPHPGVLDVKEEEGAAEPERHGLGSNAARRGARERVGLRVGCGLRQGGLVFVGGCAHRGARVGEVALGEGGDGPEHPEGLVSEQHGHGVARRRRAAQRHRLQRPEGALRGGRGTGGKGNP